MSLAILFAVAVVAGALNAVAGGGSFLGLPALLFAGVPAVSANATTTFAMWPGSIASAVAYRRDIGAQHRRRLVPLVVVSVLGGWLGGELLMRTSDTSFMTLLPWLMLIAAVTFTFGRSLTGRRDTGDSGVVPTWTLALQLVIAVYGGYFGGGIGIMMLAVLSLSGMSNIHEMNGLKVVLAVAINGIALVEFMLSGAIVWAPGLVMASGGIVGGYAGAGVARRLPPAAVRTFVVVVAWLMTAYFFVRPV